jgi:hypothetical protein
MSKQPANPKDLEELTEYWHRETNYVNQKVDDAFKAAQDHAYALGLKRGDEERSRLHAANAELVDVLSDLLDEGEFTDYPGTRQADAVKAARAALSKHKEQQG